MKFHSESNKKQLFVQFDHYDGRNLDGPKLGVLNVLDHYDAKRLEEIRNDQNWVFQFFFHSLGQKTG